MLIVDRDNIRTHIIVFLLIAMEGFFYLVDTDSINISGVFNYDLIWLLLLVLFLLWNYLSFAMWNKKIKCHFGTEIFVLVIFVFVAAYQCFDQTGQPLFRGISPQRNWLIILLSYFVIRELLALELVNKEALVKGLVYVGIISVIIFLIQVGLGDSIELVHVKTNERYDSIRLYVDSAMAVIIGFFGINDFFNTRKYRGIILVVLAFLYELFVAKGRLELVSFVAAIVIGMLIARNYGARKLAMWIIAIGCVVVFFNTDYGQSILENISYGISYYTNGSVVDRSVEVRAYGRSIYASQMLESPTNLLFGCGYPNDLYSPAANRGLLNADIKLSDNGIFGFAYVYGLAGTVTAIILFLKMLIYGWRLYKINNNCVYLMFTIFQIFLMYNITFWWVRASWTFVTVIMMSLLEYELFDIDHNENDEQEVQFYEEHY